MHEESDSPALTGQVAGIIAMLSAILKTLPPTTRRRLQPQVHAEFESLLTAISTTDGPQAQAERNSVEWIRDLFLNRLEQLNSKQTARRNRKGKADSAPRPVLDNTPPIVERRATTNVDLEL